MQKTLNGLKFKVLNNNLYNGIYFITETFDKFISTKINGNSVDFGLSEIEIVAENKQDFFNIGKTINFFNDTESTILKTNVIKRSIKNMQNIVNIKTSLAEKSINFYNYGEI